MQAGGSPEAGHPIQDSDHLPDLWLHRQGEGRVHEQVEGVLQRQRGHCSHDVWHQLRLQKVLLTWKLTNAENSRILEFQKGMMKRMNVLSPCFLRPNKGQKQRWRPFLAERLSQMSLDLVQDDFFNWSVRDETLFSDQTNSLWHAFWGWAFWPIYQHSLGQGRTYIWFVDYFFLFHSILLKLWSQEDKYLILF